jgi:hypothetical protein
MDPEAGQRSALTNAAGRLMAWLPLFNMQSIGRKPGLPHPLMKNFPEHRNWTALYNGMLS